LAIDDCHVRFLCVSQLSSDSGWSLAVKQEKFKPARPLPGRVSKPSEGDDMKDAFDVLRQLYDRFNARDIEAVLAAMDENVIWANGMEGGHVHGREAVRRYWTHQWSLVNPHVEPLSFTTATDGSTVVEVHQTVRSLAGKILREQAVGHIFQFRDGAVVRFDIRGAAGT
jgi:ketosteroid isomerase-like protein